MATDEHEAPPLPTPIIMKTLNPMGWAGGRCSSVAIRVHLWLPTMPSVLITGTSSGIGLVSAVEMARRGWTVIASMRDPARGERLREAAARAGVAERLAIEALDVTDAASFPDALARVLARAGGRLDAVVHNAGIAVGGAFEDLPEAELRRVMETNFFAVLALTRALLPTFRAQRQGRIVVVSSNSAFAGEPANSIYVASKWAIEGWAESLAYEVERFGIDVVLDRARPYRTEIWQSSPRILPEGSPYAPWLAPARGRDRREGDGQRPRPARGRHRHRRPPWRRRGRASAIRSARRPGSATHARHRPDPRPALAGHPASRPQADVDPPSDAPVASEAPILLVTAGPEIGLERDLIAAVALPHVCRRAGAAAATTAVVLRLRRERPSSPRPVARNGSAGHWSYFCAESPTATLPRSKPAARRVDGDGGLDLRGQHPGPLLPRPTRRRRHRLPGGRRAGSQPRRASSL